MDHSWEDLATQIANKPENDVLNFIQSKYDEFNNESKAESKSDDDDKKNPVVCIGRDTRPHSSKLAALVAKAASAIKTKVIIKL